MAKPKNIKVTDHALIRYFERFVGLDIEGFRDEFLRKVKKNVKSRNGIFISQFGYLIVKDSKIVTILTEEQAKNSKLYK